MAGVLANLVGALFVTVLGTGLIALLIEVEWLRPLVYHAPHMSEAAAYGHVLHASQHVEQLHNHVRDLPDHRAHHERPGRGLLHAGAAPSPARSQVTAAARQAPGLGPHPSPRPRAVASPTPRTASPSFHDRGQFGAHSTGFWP